MRTDKQILLVAQKNASDDEPLTDGIYAMGTLASVLQLLKLPDGTVKVLVEGTVRAAVKRYTDNENYFEAEIERVRGDDRLRGRDRGAVALGRDPVRELREAQQENLARGARHHGADRRLFQARRYHRLASRHQDRREAADPRDHHGLRAARARVHADGERDLRAPGREEDPEPRQASDGEDAARVLSERADEGDPEGARRRRRGPRRSGRDRAEDREDQAVEGGSGEGARRAEEAPPDEPDVGRGDRRPQLSRLAVDDPVGRQGQDQARPRRGPE